MTINTSSPPIIGPSDSSDTAADLMGSQTTEGQPDQLDDLAFAHGNSVIDATTDRSRTGERLTAEAEEIQEAADIGFDRVVSAEEAGLGGGLDQAEEAQLGITDEELEAFVKKDQASTGRN